MGACERWELHGPSVEGVARSFAGSRPTVVRSVRKANGLPPEPWGRRPRPGEEDS